MLSFGDFELDETVPELRRAGAVVELQPKVLDLLLELARQRDRVVSRRELLERVWPGVVVSDGALTTAVNAARAALDDEGANQRVIRTVPRRGYRFVADASESAPGAPAPSDDYIGREEVLARLWRELEQAGAGRGGMVLLAGDPGIGKTRTAEELLRAARAKGARVLAGWCPEGDGAPPYWPWVQMLRRWGEAAAVARALPPTTRAELARLLPELAGKASPLPPAEAGAEQRSNARFRLHEAVASLLRAAAELGPLVVFVDDLHWADAASLRLLAFAARDLASARVLFVASYRPDDVRGGAPIASALAELARLPRHERVVLAGLGRDDVARFLEAQLGATPHAALIDEIHARSEGNPFFIRELVRLVEGPAETGAMAAPGASLPHAARDVITARLGRLSDDSRELLRVAAVIGRDFETDLLERASGCPAGELARRLDESERARLIREAPGTGFRFAHALIREELYAELGAAARRELHRRVATALEESLELLLEPPLAELAHHWCRGARAADGDRVGSTALRAGRAALARLGFEDAAAIARRALGALDELRVAALESRCDLFALLVEAEFSAGNGPAWREALRQAVGLARQLGAPQRLAHIAIYVGDMVTGVVDRQTIALYEESLAALGDGADALRAELLSGLACALYWSAPDRERVRACSDEALALARRLGNPEVLAVVLNNRHLALWSPDSSDERRAVSQEFVALASRNRSRRGLHDARHRHLLDALERADAAAVNEDLGEIAQLARELRFPGWESAPGATLRALLDGRLDDAERIARARFEAIERAGFANASMFLATQLAMVRREQGRLGELAGGIRALVEQYPTLPTWRATLAYAYHEADHPEAARLELERLVPPDFADLPRDATWLTSIGLLAEVAAAQADPDPARRLLRLLEPFADRMIVLGPSLAVASSVARPLALLHGASGDVDAADACFERALALELGLGARCLATRTRRQWAALLLVRSRARDRERAHALAEQAHEDARTLGMRAEALRARAILEELAGVIRLPVGRQRRARPGES